MQKEIWKAIPGYEDIYEVSSFGNVRSLDRTVVDGKKLKGATRKLSNSRGYRVCALSWGGKATTYGVHILVAMAFIGACPVGFCVHHKDENKSNNRIENLEYVSIPDHVRMHAKPIEGENNPMSVLTESDVKEIREIKKTGKMDKEIAKLFGISRRHVNQIVNGVRWGWLQ